MDVINAYLAKESAKVDNSHGFKCVPVVICSDGFKMSVQASKGHYCSPREVDAHPYSSVEIGFPSRRIPEAHEYAEDKKRHTKTVFGFVPVRIVNEIIRKHGGLRHDPRPR